MKRLSLAALVAATAAVVPGAASAQAPVPGLQVWQGFYTGLHTGLGSLSARSAGTQGFDGGEGVFSSPYRVSSSVGSLIGGWQAGYNFQLGLFVVGPAFAVSFGNFRSNTALTGFEGFITSFGTRGSVIGSARMRAGVAIGNFMPYVTAGVAFTDMSYRFAFFGGEAVGSAAFRTGVVAGGGIEAIVAPNWTIFTETLYYDFGSTRANFNFGGEIFGQFANTRSSASVVVVRVGFNYLFR